MDHNQKLPIPYKNKAGKVLGDIIAIEGEIYPYLRINLTGLGEWTISEYDNIDDERLKAIAEYKKVCIEGAIEELTSEIKEREEKIKEYEERLKLIDDMLKECKK